MAQGQNFCLQYRKNLKFRNLKLRNLIHYLKVVLARTTEINLKCKQILNQETLYQDSTM